MVCYCVRLWLRVDTSSLGLLSVNMSGLHKIQNFSVLLLVRLVWDLALARIFQEIAKYFFSCFSCHSCLLSSVPFFTLVFEGHLVVSPPCLKLNGGEANRRL